MNENEPKKEEETKKEEEKKEEEAPKPEPKWRARELAETDWLSPDIKSFTIESGKRIKLTVS